MSSLPRPSRRLRSGASLISAGALLAAGLPGVAAEPDDDPNAGWETSYEQGDPALDWTGAEAHEGGSKAGRGLETPPTPIIDGNLFEQVVGVSASAENAPGETAAMATDGDPRSKWLAFASQGWLQLELDEPVMVDSYAIVSGNDAPQRDPRTWKVLGSDDGQSWTELGSETDQDSWPERNQVREFTLDNDTAYRYYRLQVDAVQSGSIIQLSEWSLVSSEIAGEPAEPGMEITVGDGPTSAYASKTEVGFTGTQALHYAGRVTAEDGGRGWHRLHDVDITVSGDTELTYAIFPEFNDDLDYPATWAGVDLRFTDGTYLSDLPGTDQYGFGAGPVDQGASKSLYTNQWNSRSFRLGGVAAGKTVDYVLLGYDNPSGPAEFTGWVDDLSIGEVPVVVPEHRSDYVNTLRGTHSSGGFSRGNNIPATAVPNGFNFWVPITDAKALNWIYSWHQHNDEQNRPRLEAFAASHEPSPWMGERQTFQVMPSIASGAPDVGRDARAMTFSHDNEVARPHSYTVEFDNGLVTEMAPTDHAAIMRFTFPGDDANLIFDNVDSNAGLTLHDDGTVTGYSDVRSGLSAGATRMFVYGTLDAPVLSKAKVQGDPGGSVTGYVKVDAGADRQVNLRLATSLISLDQAQTNLERELSADSTFEQVRDAARSTWDDALSVIDVEGASQDQLTTLYSNLYRLFLYPNSGYENVGTLEAPDHKYASPVTPGGPSTPEETGAEIVDGKIYVNNGFWDTYRTAWPAYALLAPDRGAELADGFVQQYRDGGWISRWSSPGYANLMTGTSSDVAFADMATKGVDLPDPMGTYLAGLKNATVAPPGNANNSNVGRKGQQLATFLGWTTTDVGEGTSWGLEGYINDFGLSHQAAQLAQDDALSEAERTRLEDEAAYLANRSLNYVNAFDPAVGFFQGRHADGTFRFGPEEYSPLVWGQHDYTETNGWNFAFHVPFDGQGLANLYGGRDGLAAKLDEFFSTPETAKHPGTYNGIIHEMVEARDVRMGMWGFSNQVSHHIPYTYVYAAQPWKTQAITREVLSRHYTGSDIGQGYAGDEDNGETSAWWLFASLGLYPLQMGDGNYVLTSPLFDKATVNLPNGKQIVVQAHDNSAENVYVQSLTVDGKRWGKAWIDHEQLADGAVLEFTMGPEPSSWGSQPSQLPPSPTTGDEVATPLADVIDGPAGVGGVPAAGRLADDTSLTETTFDSGSTLSYTSLEPRADVEMYTLTSPSTGTAPSGWILEGSKNDKVWKTLDEREGQDFEWARQTRPFQIENPGSFTHYRLTFTGPEGTLGLAEVELLGTPGKELKEDEWLGAYLDRLSLGDDPVTHQVELPSGGDEVELTWTSGDTSWITDDGWLVRRPAAGEPAVEVTMHVVAERGDASGERSFTVQVAPWSDDEPADTFSTGFDGGDPTSLRNDRLVSEHVAEFCCGIGGMETAQGEVPVGSSSGRGGVIYSGIAVDAEPSLASSRILRTDGLWVREGSRLSYAVYPESGNGRVSGFVSVDILFTDGTVLRDLGATASNGAGADPLSQGAVLEVDTWNTVTVDLGEVAAGKQVRDVLFSFGSGEANGNFRGWADDVAIGVE